MIIQNNQQRPTDWSKTRVHMFHLTGMVKPVEIIDHMTNLNIMHYVYAIYWNNVLVKYGMSEGQTTRPGERLYRQIGHIPSFGQHTIHGSNGIDFRVICQHLELEYGKKVDHNDMTVFVWDFTNYPWHTISKPYELDKAETYLIQEHLRIHNRLPIGNLYDKNICSKQSAPDAVVCQTLFANLDDSR